MRAALKTPTPAVLIVLAAATAGMPARGETSPAAADELLVFPTSIYIDAADDDQRFTVLLAGADGMNRDVTAEAQVHVSPPEVARCDAAGRLVAGARGEAALTATWNGLQAAARVVVREAEVRRPLSFRHDVEPVLMKAGCNAGGCHGNARGQEGFRLSLFGYDPGMDYVNLTREAGARRIDVADPPASLILRKPLAEVTHGGGRRFEPGSLPHDLLRRWIESGAPDDPPSLPPMSGIELLPRSCVMAADGASQQLVVRAAYADGSDRDVTELALLTSLDEGSVVVDDHGRAIARAPGEAFVMARFGTFAVVSQLIVVADRPFVWPAEITPFNYIDQAVFDKLRRLRLAPSPVCSDAEFLRRVSVDIVGLPPTVAEFRRFMDDSDPHKRARKIDELLQRPEFPELWAMKWSDLLRIESNKLKQKGVQLYSAWLRDAFQNDMRLDHMARALLTAEGGNFHHPPSNFFLVEHQPHVIAENVAQVFTGIRLQCAQCHNHPFDRWTQDDYYSFAAFFAQVGRKQTEDPRETVIYHTGSGEVRHPRDGRVMRPRFLGGNAPQVAGGQDPRQVLAEWLTGPENPYFAANLVNRVWQHFFGRGIVEPPDDVRVSNPPSHPDLLRGLSRQFIDSGYDLRALVRDICRSRTYQTSSRSTPENARDRRNLSHALLRRLPAEQLLDAVSQVTGVPEKFSGLPLGARAAQVADAVSGSYFLKVFGRPARESACTCERRNEPTLSQALHLINGATVWHKLKDPSGRLHRRLQAGVPTEDIVEELYIAALSRLPTSEEERTALEYVANAPQPAEGLEDVLWALLNSQEFLFNH